MGDFIDTLIIFQDVAQVEDQLDVGFVGWVDPFFDLFDLFQEGNGFVFKFGVICETANASLLDLILKDLIQDQIAFIHNLLETHVDPHLSESMGLIFDVFHDL